MYDVYFTPDTWDDIEIGLGVYYRKPLKQIIQQVKIDMYKDRYKTYDSPHASYFYACF